ncbi:hypothetical protein NIIDNTM18_19840 [Mycolicibacterium litorale]|uniref:Uncharacterized protein n=1 Tax=Mycolicibacterium litorale TaxID=758802 RepID=A0A6S6P3X6_9MYCO|nr:hypothetical protein [Mycolicibacterium litorale]BCI52706.1 hypothetical protein NIIDNTM18_19840 [Mycolicibacterium litorale]
MVSQSLQVDDLGRTSRIPGATATRLEYRLDVLATDPADLVRFAGGWMFDRAMAGWRVNAWLLDADDLRPLQILGVPAHRLEPGAIALDDDRAAGLAVSADLTASAAVRDEVRSALTNGSTEVVLWGGRWPEQWGGRPEPVRYRLSAAARIFKKHALTAAGCPDAPVGATESLVCGGHRPVDSDLVTSGR